MYSFLPVFVIPPLIIISIIASGAIDSETNGSVKFLNASDIPLTKPLDNWSSVSIPCWILVASVLNGASR